MPYKTAPEVNGLSDLANQVEDLKDETKDRGRRVTGVVLHTTGTSIVEQALKKKNDVLDHVVAYYLNPKNYSPHYVIGYWGEIVQIADEHERALHVGYEESDRRAYRDGSWTKRVPKVFLDSFKAEFGEEANPVRFLPGLYALPNDSFVGVELIPTLRPEKETGLRYTKAQHESAAQLVLDIHRRWKPSEIHPTDFAFGHEDVNPLKRTSPKIGGWDPGARRTKPWFSWKLFFDYLKPLLNATPADYEVRPSAATGPLDSAQA